MIEILQSTNGVLHRIAGLIKTGEIDHMEQKERDILVKHMYTMIGFLHSTRVSLEMLLRAQGKIRDRLPWQSNYN